MDNNDSISRSALLKAMEEERQYLLARGQTGAEHILVHHCLPLIDNAPTVKFSLIPADESKDEAYMRGYEKGKIAGILKANTRPQGSCKSCRHRDPEDKKCDCGGQERQGCPFPVRDNYFCKFYEKGGAE